MSLLFALRGDSLTPRYAIGGKLKHPFLAAANFSNPPRIITAASISAVGTKGTSLISVNTENGDERAMKYITGGNWVRDTNIFSIRLSFVPNWSGNPAYDRNLFIIGNDANNFFGGVKWMIYTDGKLNVFMKTGDGVGTSMVAAQTASALSFTSKTKTEIMVTCDGTTVKASQDGVEVGSWALSVTDRYMNNVIAASMMIGPWSVDAWVDELCIWDSVQPHVYTPVASYEPCDEVDGTESVDPGVANVLNSAGAYKINGVAKVGTYAPADFYTSPPEDMVLEGTVWAHNSETNNREGTYVPPDTTDVKEGVVFGNGEEGELVSTDPGEANVARGVEYFINSDDFEGTLDNVTNIISSAVLRGPGGAALIREVP